MELILIFWTVDRSVSACSVVIITSKQSEVAVPSVSFNVEDHSYSGV